MIVQKNRKWILVVEDDEDVRELLVEMIDNHFAEAVSVIEARDGVEASVKINLQAFDCILTDVEMPRKQGDSLIKQIRANSLNNLTPVIIVSGSEKKVAIQEANDFVYLIAKPFEQKDLLDLIDNQLKIGGNDKRVSVDTLNGLVGALTEFVSEATGEQLVREGVLVAKPVGKNIGEFLSSTIKVNIGEVVNTFSILVPDKDLQFIANSSESLKGKESQQIIKSMAFVVLKHVMDKSGLIKREQFNANLLSSDSETIRSKAGVLLSLRSPKLNIQIFASTR